MIVLLNTSTADSHLVILSGDSVLIDAVWHADRELAEKLLSFLRESLDSVGGTWDDIQGVGFYKGPGSFTGLRIGASVVNTLASDRGFPIVAVGGDDWQAEARERLGAGEDDRIVQPDYGRPANITQPRK